MYKTSLNMYKPSLKRVKIVLKPCRKCGKTCLKRRLNMYKTSLKRVKKSSLNHVENIGKTRIKRNVTKNV